MEHLDDEVKLIRRLMASVDVLATAPDVSQEVRKFAGEVNAKYNRLKLLMDERGFREFGLSIQLPETIKLNLEKSLKRRRDAEISAVAGNGVRIVGTLLQSQPVGDIMFWVGFGISCLSDAVAESAGHDAKKQAKELDRILKEHNDGLRDLAKSVRDLDDTIKARTGMSLYDDEFQAFLEQAEKDPDDAEELAAGATKDAEERRNLMAVVRDGEALKILKSAVSFALKEDIAILTAISQGLNALSFLQFAPCHSAAMQVGEISLRGIILVIEHKRTAKSLSHFARGIALMKKEYEALDKIYGVGAP